MKPLDFKTLCGHLRAAVTGKGASTGAFRGGSYAMVVTAIVLAIAVLINVAVSALPTNLTQFDISAAKLYSITSNTKVVVNNLKEDVTIYWIVQADEEDATIERLLDKYDSLSDHVKVEKKNPDVYPTFAEQYTDEEVANNSLVVVSGDRSRYIAYDDIYVTDADMYSYSYSTSFDGEGAITSAIDYVVTEDLPQLYVLEGHGEQELPSTFADQITKENIETTQFSLLTEESVPEEADAVLIYSPQSDISEEEKTKLADYAEGGGRLLVIAGPVDGSPWIISRACWQTTASPPLKVSSSKAARITIQRSRMCSCRRCKAMASPNLSSRRIIIQTCRLLRGLSLVTMPRT